MKAYNLSGNRYGRLVAIRPVGTRGHYKLWECVCNCGNQVFVTSRSLVSGHTKSCGCLFSDQLSARKIKHGGTGSRIYSIWKSMNYRCKSPKSRNYMYYGGRGIKVCDKWLSFPAFYEWAMKNGYQENLSIDRIDVNGDYCPDNCRWATMKEQRANQRERSS